MNRKAFVIVGIVAAVAVAMLYAFVDPLDARWLPKCMVYQLTGFKCPGCGTQRALHALFTGHPADAFRANAALVPGLLLCVALIVAEQFRDSVPGVYRALNSRTMIMALLVVIIAWTLFRNVFGW